MKNDKRTPGTDAGTGTELQQGVWAVVVTFLVAIAFAASAPYDRQIRMAAAFLAVLAAGLVVIAWRMTRAHDHHPRPRHHRAAQRT